MPTPIREIISRLHEHAPLTLAEPWDNAGLLLGDMDRVATSILIGLDPTASLVEEAIALGAAHHHHPSSADLQTLARSITAEPTGRFIELALSHRDQRHRLPHQPRQCRQRRQRRAGQGHRPEYSAPARCRIFRR